MIGNHITLPCKFALWSTALKLKINNTSYFHLFDKCFQDYRWQCFFTSRYKYFAHFSQPIYFSYNSLLNCPPSSKTTWRQTGSETAILFFKKEARKGERNHLTSDQKDSAGFWSRRLYQYERTVRLMPSRVEESLSDKITCVRDLEMLMVPWEICQRWRTGCCSKSLRGRQYRKNGKTHTT